MFKFHLLPSRRLSLSSTITFVLICLGLILSFYTVIARADDSSWLTGSATAKKVIDNASSDQYMAATRTCQYNDSTPVTTSPPVVQQQPLCAYQTTYGNIARDENEGKYYMRQGIYGAYSPIMYPIVQPVPNSDQLLLAYDDRYRPFRSFVVVKPAANFKLNGSGSSYGYYPSYFGTEIKSPTTGQPLWINDIGVSNNGHWAVFNTISGLIRYDLLTNQYVKFHPLNQSSGSGTHYELDISDDGRFVVVSGGAFRLNVFDLNRCSFPSDPDQAASDCYSVDITQPVSELSSIDAYHDTMISPDGKFITTVAYDRTSYTHDVWRFSLPVTHHLDYLAMGDSFSSGEGDALSAVPSHLATLYGNLPAAYLTQYFTSIHYLPGTDGNADATAAVNQGIDTKAEKCHISNRSYPFLLAANYDMGNGQANGSRFRAIACTGSAHKDIYNTQDKLDLGGYKGRFKQLESSENDGNTRRLQKDLAIQSYVPGRAAQVEFISKYKPKAVTITISGNDVGFGEIIRDCIMPGPTCAQATNADTKQVLATQIKKQYGEIKNTISIMRAASPKTKFYIVGYPRITKTDAFCPQPNAILNQAERILADNIAVYLNDVIQAAATSSGVMYVDVENTLISKGLCSGELLPVVNGLRIGEEQPEINLATGNQITIPFFGAESYHPNSRGHQLLFEAIRAQIGNPAYRPVCNSVSDTFCGTATPEPAMPAYFQSSSSSYPTLSAIATMIARTSGEIIDTAGSVIAKAGEAAGRVIITNLNNDVQQQFRLASNASFALELHSTPVILGSGTTSSTGAINAPFMVPADTPPGYHTLHLKTTLETGEPIDITQRLFVIKSETDFDGDGISNTTDQCPFVTPSGIDANRDGRDDACPTEDDAMPAPPDISRPIITAPTYTNNPKPAGQSGTLTIKVTDPKPAAAAPYSLPANVSGLNTASPSSSTPPASGAPAHTYAAEYFIGDTDPGLGRAAPLRLATSPAPSGSSTPATSPVTPTTATYFAALDTTLPVGTHKVTIRARDRVGNWATTTDYLVVYSATGSRANGRTVFTPSTVRGDLLPGLLYKAGVTPGTPSPWPTNPPQADQAWFGFNVQFTRQAAPASHTINPGSNLRFYYATGSYCQDLSKAKNCQITQLDTTSLTHFFTSDTNGSTGTLYGTAVVKRTSTTDAKTVTSTNADGSTKTTTTPGVKTTSSQNVTFKAVFSDAIRKTTDTTVNDTVALLVYPSTVNPQSPGSAQPIYKIPMLVVPRGTLRIYN